MSLMPRATLPLLICTALLASSGPLLSGCSRSQAATNEIAPQAATTASVTPVVELSAEQLKAIKIAPAESAPFAVEKEEVGSIDFDNNVYFDSNLSAQVFPPYRGTMRATYVELDDEVRAGQPLYAIDSPELTHAESALLDAVHAANQARDDAADARVAAARAAVRALGKSDEEIDALIASGKPDPTLVVRSPISGRVSSVNAPVGLEVQPGLAPAPCAVARVSVKWMLANVPESDSPFYRVGEPVKVKVNAFPGRIFPCRVSKIYPTVDATSHRVTIRFELADPRNELRSGMLTSLVTQVRAPTTSVAVPENGVVREGDGTMTAWVTTDRRHFAPRTITAGLRRDGLVQVLAGIAPGELVVTDGAVFLSNMLNASPTD